MNSAPLANKVLKKLVSISCCCMVILNSCVHKTSSTTEITPLSQKSDIGSIKEKPASTRYMPSGFYFLTEGADGVPMRKDHSDKVYVVAPKPFVSVKNFVETGFKYNHLESGLYIELELRCDSIGKKDMEEGTGNPFHSKIALVIANRLLYVVDNNLKISDGRLDIGLVGYTNEEMKAMRIAIDHKK